MVLSIVRVHIFSLVGLGGNGLQNFEEEKYNMLEDMLFVVLPLFPYFSMQGMCSECCAAVDHNEKTRLL